MSALDQAVILLVISRHEALQAYYNGSMSQHTLFQRVRDTPNAVEVQYMPLLIACSSQHASLLQAAVCKWITSEMQLEHNAFACMFSGGSPRRSPPPSNTLKGGAHTMNGFQTPDAKRPQATIPDGGMDSAMNGDWEFLVGTAISVYQNSGGDNNNWWRYERQRTRLGQPTIDVRQHHPLLAHPMVS